MNPKATTVAKRVSEIYHRTCTLAGLLELLRVAEERGATAIHQTRLEVVRSAEREMDALYLELYWLQLNAPDLQDIPAPDDDERAAAEEVAAQ